jgi:uncharacterized protein (DUF2062 family)
MIRLRPVVRFVKFRILHIDDCPKRMARGIAVGVYTAFLPFFGLHILIALLAAAATKSNKAMAATFVWISNPLTAVIIYYPCYKVGHWILSLFQYGHDVNPEQIDTMLDIFSLRVIFTQCFTAEFWKQVSAVCMVIGLETLIGGLILGALAAKLSYWLSRAAINKYHRRKHKRREQITSK